MSNHSLRAAITARKAVKEQLRKSHALVLVANHVARSFGAAALAELPDTITDALLDVGKAIVEAPGLASALSTLEPGDDERRHVLELLEAAVRNDGKALARMVKDAVRLEAWDDLRKRLREICNDLLHQNAAAEDADTQDEKLKAIDDESQMVLDFMAEPANQTKRLTQDQIAAGSEVSRRTVTMRLKTLVRDGLVERHGERSGYTITPKGRTYTQIAH